MTQAERHMDSDLAVDGLALRQFVTEGRWRWHYPGTPHIGTAPMLLSLPAVAVWGEGPESLVFAGVAANLLLIAGVYLLLRQCYGQTPAFFAGLLLAAGGLGQVWLSARVTGGHLLAAAWLAWAWLAWSRLIQSARLWPWLVFGLFCGLGLWVDSLFLIALPGLGLASVAQSWNMRNEVPIGTRAKQAFLFIALLPVGPALLKLGDGVNVYGAQFELTLDQAALQNHAVILLLECLPRLVLGRVLPYATTSIQMPRDIIRLNSGLWPTKIIYLSLSAALLILPWLAKPRLKHNQPASIPPQQSGWLQAMRAGLLLTFILNTLAFILNKNIFNADNYRYLVLQLVPLGLFYGRLASCGRVLNFSRLLLIGMAAFSAIDVYHWQSEFGLRRPEEHAECLANLRKYVDHVPKPESLGSLIAQQPNRFQALIDDGFEADYWDTYKTLYINNIPVTKGKPYGLYPNRFPDQSPSHPRFIVVSGSSGVSARIFQMIRAENAKLYLSTDSFEIYDRWQRNGIAGQFNNQTNTTNIEQQKISLK